MSDYENEGFDESPQKQPTKQVIVAASKLQKVKKTVQAVNLIIKPSDKLAASKN